MILTRRAALAFVIALSAAGCSTKSTTEGAPGAQNAPPGAAYLGVAGKGLVRIAADGTITQVGPPISTFHDLVAAPDGSVYAAAMSIGLVHVSGDIVETIDLGTEGDALGVEHAPDGTLLARTYTSIVRREGKGWARFDTAALGDDSKNVRDIVATETGLWAFSSDHAYFAEGFGPGARFVKRDPSPAPGEVGFESVQRTGYQGFVALADSGTFTFGPSGWKKLDVPVEPSRHLAIGPDGTLYVARLRGGVEHYQREATKLTPLPKVEASGIDFTAESLAVDQRGRLWQVDARGAYITHDGKTTKLSKETSPVLDGQIVKVVVIAGGPTLK